MKCLVDKQLFNTNYWKFLVCFNVLLFVATFWILVAVMTSRVTWLISLSTSTSFTCVWLTITLQKTLSITYRNLRNGCSDTYKFVWYIIDLESRSLNSVCSNWLKANQLFKELALQSNWKTIPFLAKM